MEIVRASKGRGGGGREEEIPGGGEKKKGARGRVSLSEPKALREDEGNLNHSVLI